MSQSCLIVPSVVAARLCDDVGRYGQNGVETGGFLLTKPGSDMTHVVALAGAVGIIRQYGLFVITRPAFDAVFTWAEENDLRVRALVHSHAKEAFLSPTDRRGGLLVNGFASAVIPNFADPPRDPAAWRWWVYASDWIPASPPLTEDTATKADIVIFDGDGVRAD